MGRGRLFVPVILLDVLAVIAGVAGQPEHALLEDRVDAVPQRESEAERLLLVAEAGHAVLVPPEDPRPRVIMREVGPGVAVLAVVLADRAPGPLGQIRPPRPPAPRAGVRLG